MPAVAALSEEGSERSEETPVSVDNTDEQDAMSPDRIAQIRERAGWTLQEMGDTLGVGRATVYRWETGERRPNQYHREVLRNIEQQLDQRDEQQRQQFVQAITGLAAGASVAALLHFLFSDSNSPNSGDSESTDQSQ
jgi:DNA-binding transcriptional regulator YiaG